MTEKTLAELKAERAALDDLITNYPTTKPGNAFVPQPGMGLQRQRFAALTPAEQVAHIRVGGTVFD
jgi:hypothetical protein